LAENAARLRTPFALGHPWVPHKRLQLRGA